MIFRSHMEHALTEARAAAARGEVPVGAVVVAPGGAVVASAGNRTRELCDPACGDAGDSRGLYRPEVGAADGA